MVNRFRIGTIAALGSGTAALAMLTGLAGARADDLQINQQLLDTRVDQLAAVGQGAGGSGNTYFSIDPNSAAGAAATAGSFPRSILIPGTDTSIKIYGQMTEILDYFMSGGQPNSATSGPWNTTIDDNGFAQSIPLPITLSATPSASTGNAARARSNGIFGQSPRESKIGFETRTPTPFGEARTVMEFDWAGATQFAPASADPTSVSDNLIPRLRYAYGTLGGLLAGQATSNFADPDANGETLDFGGNFGEPGRVRIPEIRYTMPAWWGGSFSVSAEQPETIIATPVGTQANDASIGPTLTTSCTAAAPAVASAATSTCTTSLVASGNTPLNPAKATAPDFTAAYYLPQQWGHIDVSGVLRPGIDVTDGHYFDHQYIGFGGHIGADVKPGWFGWVKDDIIAHFVIGNTMGPYLNSSSNVDLTTNYGGPSTNAATPGTYGGFNGPTSAAAAANIIFHTVSSMGGEIGYQHWWLDNLRSNINAGFEAQSGLSMALVSANGTTLSPTAKAAATQNATLNKELISTHLNLIWNPVSFVDIGIEWTYAQRTVLNNQNASQNALISKFAFRF